MGTKLTVAAAAVHAQVSKSTVYSWIETGMLPHYRVPARRRSKGKILIAVEDLDAFIASLRVEARPENLATPPPKRKLQHLSMDRD